MERKSIPIHLLVTTKTEIGYHKRPKADFIQLIQMVGKNKKIDVPIEVYYIKSGHYVINDGVHRAKAAQLVGLYSIDAIIYTDSLATGIFIPLSEVKW